MAELDDFGKLDCVGMVLLSEWLAVLCCPTEIGVVGSLLFRTPDIRVFLLFLLVWGLGELPVCLLGHQEPCWQLWYCTGLFALPKIHGFPKTAI